MALHETVVSDDVGELPPSGTAFCVYAIGTAAVGRAGQVIWIEAIGIVKAARQKIAARGIKAWLRGDHTRTCCCRGREERAQRSRFEFDITIEKQPRKQISPMFAQRAFAEIDRVGLAALRCFRH